MPARKGQRFFKADLCDCVIPDEVIIKAHEEYKNDDIGRSNLSLGPPLAIDPLLNNRSHFDFLRSKLPEKYKTASEYAVKKQIQNLRKKGYLQLHGPRPRPQLRKPMEIEDEYNWFVRRLNEEMQKCGLSPEDYKDELDSISLGFQDIYIPILSRNPAQE